MKRISSNVRWAVKDMRIDYPVAVDNEHVIWRAFRNNYWPALYFVDAQGRIRHQHFGEGAYDQSEMIIQQLLREAGANGVSMEPVSVDGRGLEAAADWGSLRSGENYVGYERTKNFASPGGAALDKPRMYELPARLRLNEWALVRRLDGEEGSHRAEQGQWTYRVPFSRARSPSRHGSENARNARAISRADRWTSRQVRPTEATSTSRATAQSRNSACTS